MFVEFFKTVHKFVLVSKHQAMKMYRRFGGEAPSILDSEIYGSE